MNENCPSFQHDSSDDSRTPNISNFLTLQHVFAAQAVRAQGNVPRIRQRVERTGNPSELRLSSPNSPSSQSSVTVVVGEHSLRPGHRDERQQPHLVLNRSEPQLVTHCVGQLSPAARQLSHSHF